MDRTYDYVNNVRDNYTPPSSQVSSSYNDLRGNHPPIGTPDGTSAQTNITSLVTDTTPLEQAHHQYAVELLRKSHEAGWRGLRRKHDAEIAQLRKKMAEHARKETERLVLTTHRARSGGDWFNLCIRLVLLATLLVALGNMIAIGRKLIQD